jgi:hypothetical protein
MRLAIVIGAAVLAFAVPATLEAQQGSQKNAPYDMWCREESVARGSSVMICSAYTYQQCMASRTSHTQTCYLNPRYDPRFRRN